MVLSDEKAREILKSPRHKNEIESAKEVESQLRVFTEEMSKPELESEQYWRELKTIMKARSDKKFDRVMMFSRFPLPVVQICDSILNDYFKVFEGKNRFFNVEGDRNIDRLNDWISDNKVAKWIEKNAIPVFKNKPLSFVVVDRDQEGNAYLILVDSKRLIDAEIKDESGNLEYIAFVHSVKVENNVNVTNYSIYDDEHYFVFSKPDNQDTFKLITKQPHGIGYCPAKTFIKSQSNTKNKFKRRVAFSSSLSKLEDWTIFDIFRNYVDHYAPFPVTEAPKKTCPNSDCQDGKVSNEIIVNASTGETSTVWETCSACGGEDGGQHIYPGTHIGIKVQSDKSLNDGSGVFKMIFPDVDKLKYVPEKLDDIEMEIRLKTVGINNVLGDEAVNEMQVKGSFASMESILLRTKGELDDLYCWIVETVARLYYKNIWVQTEANFGTEFYLISEDDLQKRFDNAKKIGLPMEELLMIYTQLIETKYKGNGAKIDRQKMLLQLDPLPLYSTTDAFNLKEKGLIDDFDLLLKINFLNFITKFEAENAPITSFGFNLEPYQRIEKIKQTLNNYTNEKIQNKQIPASE